MRIFFHHRDTEARRKLGIEGSYQGMPSGVPKESCFEYAFRRESNERTMRKNTKIPVAIGIIAAILLFAASFNLYYLRDDSGGQLLWNADEAYLFMTVARRGVRLSYLEYRTVLKEWLNAPAFPTNQRVFLSVIRVTPSGIERHVGKVVGETADIPDFFTPIRQTIYANCQGTPCKWVGDHFENATPAEQKELDGINHLASDIDMSMNGWSKRGVGAVAGDSQFSIEIGKQLTLKVRQGNVYRSSSDSATVDLYRVGQPPQQLWHVNGQPRRVSKREYEQALSTAETL